MDKSAGTARSDIRTWTLYPLKKITVQTSEAKTTAVSLLLILLGITLNQSMVMFGANLSLSDPVSILLGIYILRRSSFVIPKHALLFFILVSSVSLITTYFIVPVKFGFNPSMISVLTGLVKIIASLVYLVIGVNLSKINWLERLLKYFSWSAFTIALGSVLFSVVAIPALNQVLFFGGSRYRGLMNDPNYFSILQNVAIVYFIRTKFKRPYLKLFVLLTLSYSVLSSGSKTGAVTLIASIGLIYFEKILRDKKSFKSVFKVLSFLMALLLGSLVFVNEIASLVSKVSSSNPSFQRIQIMLLNFTEAVSGQGSGRIDTWETALKLVRESPVFGIGLGTYTGITQSRYNFSAIAHNTYLQLAVEWGLPLAVLFFSILILSFLYVLFSGLNELLILKNMLFVFLVSSIAISLNNARIFWIIFGAILYHLRTKDAGKGGVRHG